jgi:hypothetical protein
VFEIMSTSNHVQTLVSRFESMAVAPHGKETDMLQSQTSPPQIVDQGGDRCTLHQTESDKNQSIVLADVFACITSTDHTTTRRGLVGLQTMLCQCVDKPHEAMKITKTIAQTHAVMQRLMHLLTNDASTRKMILRMISHITAGDEKNVACVAVWGILPILFSNMQSWDPCLLEDILWILSNVASTSAWYRDQILSFNPLPVVFELCNSTVCDVNLKRTAAWFLTGLCQHQPCPVFSPATITHMLTAVRSLLTSGDSPPTPTPAGHDHCVTSGWWILVYLTHELKSKPYVIQRILLALDAMGCQSILTLAVRRLPNSDLSCSQLPLLRIIWNITGDPYRAEIPSALVPIYQNLRNQPLK